MGLNMARFTRLKGALKHGTGLQLNFDKRSPTGAEKTARLQYFGCLAELQHYAHIDFGVATSRSLRAKLTLIKQPLSEVCLYLLVLDC